MFADCKRIDREFEEGDKVYVRLRPYRQMSVAVRRNLKLSPRYYGPYTVIQKIGKVAYKLDLPQTHKSFLFSMYPALKRRSTNRQRYSPSYPRLQQMEP